MQRTNLNFVQNICKRKKTIHSHFRTNSNCFSFFSSLELIPDKSKRSQYEEMLLNADDQSLIDTLLEYEILESNEKLSKKFVLLKSPRENTSIHYDLRDPKNLPKLNHGYLVQVEFILHC